MNWRDDPRFRPVELASHEGKIFIDEFPIETQPHPMYAARVWICLSRRDLAPFSSHSADAYAVMSAVPLNLLQPARASSDPDMHVTYLDATEHPGTVQRAQDHVCPR
jgi:hypothetical protein